jgi:LmbE family N-acetylglucosaminyl deacetylase
MARFFGFGWLLLLLTFHAAAQDAKPLPQADERYKADILLVVAHPDDEGAATPYLARALDEGKRVAVVYGTRGSSGANEAGAEQAAALGAVREIEARRALSTLGIANVWFLDGKDTASQNVLQSLANWEHGAALEQLIRLVRLTRPEVILTFMPGTFIGEDHGDHQAAGVLATEAFDLAGDPASFASQVAAPMHRLEPYLEGLRPWQPKKIYYFPDADREDIFRGLGPQYSVKEIDKSTKRPYWRMAVESFRAHRTQAKSFLDSLDKMSEAEIGKMATSDGGWSDAQHFVLGKSLVGGAVTSDIFANIPAGAVPFSRPEISADVPPSGVSAKLAGPWDFYAEFRRAHALTHLPHPEPPEIALQAGGTLTIPIWLGNQTSELQTVTLSAGVPTGWTIQAGAGKFSLAPKQVSAARLEINLPELADATKSREVAKEVSVTVDSNGKTIATIKLRVELRKRALPE